MDASAIIKQARGERSRRAFALAAGVPTATVSRIEDGINDTTIGMLQRLAAAGGYATRIELVRVPTLAACAHISPNSDGETWLRLRNAAEMARRNPERASAAISSRPQTDDPWALNLLAGIAEHIAETTGIDPPEWCRHVAPLPHPWTPDGTPRMIARSRATAPKALLGRGIILGFDSIWSDV